MTYQFVVQILSIWRVHRIACHELSDELKVFGVELIAIVHKLDVLLSHAVLDRRWHFHHSQLCICTIWTKAFISYSLRKNNSHQFSAEN